jgi:hypothetical protein
MAHDFILGDTDTNWSRGIKQLLPDTPTSTSMEEKEDKIKAAKQLIALTKHEESYRASRLHAGSELYRQAKQGDPGALDAIKIMVSKAKAGDPQAVRDVAIMKEAQKDFADSEKHHTEMGPATVMNKSEWQQQQANIRLQDDLLKARSPVQGDSLNDDELAVARDGGQCEQDSLTRLRGWSSIGRATPAQLAAQMAARQKAIAKRNLALAQAAAAKAANAAKSAKILSLHNYLWQGHANWLAQQDLNAKKKLQPRAKYESIAKSWSKHLIAKGRLPTSSLGADISIAMLNAMFQAIIASAQGQLLATPPVDPNLDPNSLTSYTPVYPYQTNPATALATALLAPDPSSPPDGSSTATPDPTTPPNDSDTDSSGGLNDDEAAVARDGGSSERAALARVRGISQIGMSLYLPGSRGPGAFPDVNSRPPSLYMHVSSVTDLAHPCRRQIGPHSWGSYYKPNQGNRRVNFKMIRVNPPKFIRV